MANLEDNTYYKYRSLKDFERFLDIIVNKRLYGAVYRELNDPMEGKFNRTGLAKKDFDEIYSDLKVTRICSLFTKQDNQKFPNDYLMWSHYADGHKGCCIELKITNQYNKDWNLLKINYTNQLTPLDSLGQGDRIKTLLSTKSLIWKDENEVRAIKTYIKNFKTQSPFYHIKIVAVYFGERITREKYIFYKKIISGIDDKIKVYLLREKNINTGTFPELECKIF